ncbi:MAG: hypothetical protein HY599_05510 [Candidatus Omnitrophica bacterium]|nr:hypothetical protein [Candidatus Omnitrophota bacterium]
MRRVVLGLAWISALSAAVGFVQPWAHLDVREPSMMKRVRQAVGDQGRVDGFTKRLSRVTVEVRRGTQTLTGELPSLKDLPKQVSGIQIPQMANREDAKVAMALMELLMPASQHVGLKSYVVYLLPGLALLGAVLLTWLGDRPAVPIGVAAVSSAVAGVGCWKLLTTNTQALFVAITIGHGLWMSLWAHVGLAVAAGLFLLPRRKPVR